MAEKSKQALQQGIDQEIFSGKEGKIRGDELNQVLTDLNDSSPKTAENVIGFGTEDGAEKRLEVRTGALPADRPKIRYNSSQSRWEYSDDGTNWKPLDEGFLRNGHVVKNTGTALPQRSNLNAKGALKATDNDPDTELDVKANGVDFSRMQDIDQDRVIGRTSAGTGDPEQLTMIQEWVAVPASSSDTGITGQKAQDGTDVFMCYNSSQWLRIKGDGSGIDFSF